MMNYIILNEVNSNTIPGLIIQSLPPISKPKIRTQIEEIDGRDGDIVTELGYSAYDKEFTIGTYGNCDINQVIAYFNSEGVVTFSNEPDKYYNYQIVEQIDFERLVRFKTATVTMHVQPFKYSTTEESLSEDIGILSGEGTEISLTPTRDATIDELNMYGNTEQNIVQGQDGNTVEFVPTADQLSFTLDNVDTSMENYITLGGNSYQQVVEVKDGDNIFNYGLWYNNRSNITVSTGTVTYNSYNTEIFFENPTAAEQEMDVIPNFNASASTNQSYINLYGMEIDSSAEYTVSCFASGVKAPALHYTFFDANYMRVDSAVYYSQPDQSRYHWTITSPSTAKYLIISFINNNYGETNTSCKIGYIAVKKGTNQDYSGYVQAKPTTLNPSPIMTLTGSGGFLTINSTNYPVDLGSVELCKVGEYKDYLYKKGGNWYKEAYIQKIGSYNGETINTDYMSTTGSLSTGATVYYVLSTPTITEITDSTLISQLDAIHTAPLTSSNTITSAGMAVKVNYNRVSSVPSPEQPQTIKTVTGSNTITITNGDNTENQSYSISLGTLELCKIGNYQDYIYTDGDDWYKKCQVNKLTVNTSQITLVSSYSNITYAQIPKPTDEITYGTYQGVPVYCTHATYSYGPSNWNTTAGIGKIYTQAVDNSYWIGFEKGTTLSQVQSLLSNCVIYYALKTETDTQITDQTLITQLEALSNATSYDGTTVITSTYNQNNAQMILSASVWESNQITVTNSGNIYSKPVLTIYGTGDIGVSLNGNQLFSIQLGTEGYITIDTANMEAYKDGILKNRLVTGEYDNFKLNVGENIISFSGTVTQIDVENYSRWI